MYSNILFSDYAEKISELKAYEVSANTFHNHWTLLLKKHLIPFFGDMMLVDIRYTDICKYFNTKRDMHRSSLHTHLAVLNNIFEYACCDDIIDKNPCEHYSLKVGLLPEKKPVYTVEQTELVLEYCHKHTDGLGIYIMLKTGISRAELLGITWDDVFLKDRLIYINKNLIDIKGENAVIAPTKNKHRTRYIAIDKETACFIAASKHTVVVRANKHKGVPGESILPKYLIYNKFGDKQSPSNWSKRHYNRFMKDMHEYYMQLGIDVPIVTSHRLRHTRTTIWVNEGRPPEAIIAQLGWSNTKMLDQVYGHRDIRQLRKQLGL